MWLQGRRIPSSLKSLASKVSSNLSLVVMVLARSRAPLLLDRPFIFGSAGKTVLVAVSQSPSGIPG
jgi:hypothetical protein